MKKNLQTSPTQLDAFLATHNRTVFHCFITSDLQVKVGIGKRDAIEAWVYGTVNQKTHLIEVGQLVPDSVRNINAVWKTRPVYLKRALGEPKAEERQKAMTLLTRGARIGHVFEKLSDATKAELVNGVIERDRLLTARRAFKAAKKK